MPTPADSLRAHVQATLLESFERSGLTRQQLALRAGVSLSTVYRVLDGETCGLEAVDRVSRVLGIRWRSRP